MIWRVLGVQGNLLSNFYSRIVPEVLVVNYNGELSGQLVQESVERGVSIEKRFKKILADTDLSSYMEISVVVVKGPIPQIKIHDKQLGN